MTRLYTIVVVLILFNVIGIGCSFFSKERQPFYLDIITQLEFIDSLEIKINGKPIDYEYKPREINLINITDNLNFWRMNKVQINYCSAKKEFIIDPNASHQYYNIYYFKGKKIEYLNFKKTKYMMPRY